MTPRQEARSEKSGVRSGLPRQSGNPLRLAFLLMVTLLVAPGAFGQVATGFPPFGSFGGGSFDTVDNANLNAHFAVPVRSKAGRGMPFFYAVAYDSSIWYPAGASGSQSWVRQMTMGWWTLGLAPAEEGYFTVQISDGTCGSGFWYSIFSNWLYHDPRGTPHSFAPSFSVHGTNPNCPGFQGTWGRSVAADGSGYTLCADATGAGHCIPNFTGVPAATATTRSGIVFSAGPYGAGKITDTNGNTISVSYNGIVTDTLGATALYEYGGTAQGAYYNYTNPQGTTSYYTMNTATTLLETNFGCSGVTDYGRTSQAYQTLLTSIVLPDGTSYSFSYEPTVQPVHAGAVTGRILSIGLPTGGSITYNYGNTGQHNNITCSDGSAAYLKRTTSDGTWIYTRSAGPPASTTIQDPAGNQTVVLVKGIYETQRKVYQGSSTSGTLLETVDTCYNGASIPCAYTAITLPIYNRTVQVTLPGLSPSKSYTTYNTYGLPTETDEYTYGPTFVRRTLTTYNTALNSIYVYDRPSDIQIKDSGGTVRAHSTYSYDSYGNLTGETRYSTPTATLTRTFGHGSYGVLTSATDFNGHSTTYSSFTCGNNTAFPQTISSGGLTTSLTWNCDGAVVTSVKDANNQTGTTQYNDPNFWRVTEGTAPGGAANGWRLINYTSATQSDFYLGVTDATRSSSCTGCRHDQILLDGLGRVTRTSLVNDPDGQTNVDNAYDSHGRIASVSNPYRGSPGGGDTYTYDALSRVTRVTHADTNHADASYGSGSQTCSSSTYGYGYPTLSTDESGKQRRVFNDALGRVIELDEPDSSGNLTVNTCYGYDVLGNLYQVVQGSETRTFNHDMLSRLTSATTPEAGTVSLYFTTSGGALCSGDPSAVCYRTDARGITTTYTYDALNRPTGKSYSNNNPTATAYTYDQTSCLGLSSCYNVGRRTTMSDASGGTQRAYDAMGRVLREHRTISSVTKDVTYTYNLDGSLATLTYPSGRVVTYTPSAVGRPLSAVDTANGINYALNATYAPQGAVGGVLMGYQSGGFAGITFAATYNNRLLPYTATATSSGGNALNLNFGYYANDNVQTITNNLNTARTQTYTYDNLNRLATAQSQATSGQYCWGESFGYDRYANLLSTTVTKCSAWSLSLSVNTNNQITNSGFTYDASGDMTSDGTLTYTWDARNRLQSAGGVTYTYDGDGKRVMKSSGTLYWTLPGGTPLAETDASGNILNEYIFFAGRIARRDSSGNVYYYFQDQVGTSKVITTSAGVVCYDADFLPYGQEMAYINSCPQNYKFTGLERDSETGLDHTLLRKYTSSLGRWLTPDRQRGNPFNPQSWNRYAYVLDNPCNLLDPLGLDPCNFNITIQNNGVGGSQQVGVAQAEVIRILNAAGLGVLFNQSNPDFTLKLEASASWYETRVTPDTNAQNNTWGWSPTNSANAYMDNITNAYGSGYGTELGRIAAHEFGHWALQLVHNKLERGPGEKGIMSQGDLSGFPPSYATFVAPGQVSQLQALCSQLHPSTGGGGGGGGGDGDQYVFVAGWGSDEGEGEPSSNSEGAQGGEAVSSTLSGATPCDQLPGHCGLC